MAIARAKSSCRPLVSFVGGPGGGLLRLLCGAGVRGGAIRGTAARGGGFLGLGLRALLAISVVGRVEARALERDADRLENFSDGGTTLDALRQRIVGHPLHH